MFSDPHAARTVLCVEDDATNVLLMQALFEHRPDLLLLVAGDCAWALRHAIAQPPDLMLLDLMLPDGHGCALLQQLRALPGMQQVPAVAVTTEDLPDWRRHGFDGLWPKPLPMQLVLDQLAHWLPVHRLGADIAAAAAGCHVRAAGASTP